MEKYMGTISGPDGVTLTRSLTVKNVARDNWVRIETQIKEIRGVTSCTILTNGHITVKTPGTTDASAFGSMIDKIIDGYAETPVGINAKKGRKPRYVNSSSR